MNIISNNTYSFKIFLKPEVEGGFTVFVPSLPGCITYGETSVQAISNAKEAIEAYIESCKKHGEYFSDDSDLLEHTVAITAQIPAVTA